MNKPFVLILLLMGTFLLFLVNINTFSKTHFGEDVQSENVVWSNSKGEHSDVNAKQVQTNKIHLRQKDKPKVWVSMGLCFSETTEKYGKKNYPYAPVTLLSVMLWNFVFPEANDCEVILFLVHKESNKTAEMEAYEKKLQDIQVTYKWVHADGMDCVLKAQLIRMFAFGHPLVQPTDIVMTVDVNMFLMTNKIFDPIYGRPDVLAWIYQYDRSAVRTSDEGESFGLV